MYQGGANVVSQNYTVHEEIARGASSVIYRATCKRGRLRNRLVALKKVCPISTLLSTTGSMLV